jgi:hypothetical protein
MLYNFSFLSIYATRPANLKHTDFKIVVLSHWRHG